MNEQLNSIKDVLENILKLQPKDYETYGSYAVKLNESWLSKNHDSTSKGSLVLVTGITPTPTGEGKTTTAIALTDALQKYRSTSVCLRQASLGPFFGVKGGASGGGLADLAFGNKTNLHFTGDFHAISSAHYFISALIDNHLFQGNALGFDPQRILWKRTVDMNDRSLRQIQIGLGEGNGVERKDEFIIVAASEIMATFCLSKNLDDLMNRLQKIALGFSRTDQLVLLKQLHATEALRLLLEDAIRPNLTLTRGGSPCFIHGGPFANIAHGCNSVRATESALKLSDVVVTESGFGSDLGAEKFMSIKVPVLQHRPKVAVLVASLRALKFHGGQPKVELHQPNLEALKVGIRNLDHHIHLIQNIYKIPVIVALNVFASDSEPEFEYIENYLKQTNVQVSRCYGFTKGAAGAQGLADKVISAIDHHPNLQYEPIYSSKDSFQTKLEKLATKVHGADQLIYSESAKEDLMRFNDSLIGLPICLAKTPFSLTADPKKGGLPQPHSLPIARIIPSFGAGFVVVTTGEIMLMPGLPKVPRGTQA